MRTTLDIAPDVLQAAKELAKRNRTTAGQVLSDLARQALTQSPSEVGGAGRRARGGDFLGFKPFRSRGGLVTDELVNELREAEPD